MRTALSIVVLLALVLMVLSAGCAPGPNDAEKTPNKAGQIAGFWKGLWQGMISPITFVLSVFSPRVRLYEVHNNGNWYNFGFVIGAGLFLSGGILGRRKGKA